MTTPTIVEALKAALRPFAELITTMPTWGETSILAREDYERLKVGHFRAARAALVREAESQEEDEPLSERLQRVLHLHRGEFFICPNCGHQDDDHCEGLDIWEDLVALTQPRSPSASVEAVALKDIRARIEELRPYQHSPTFIEHFATGLLKTIDDALTAQHPVLQGGGRPTATDVVGVSPPTEEPDGGRSEGPQDASPGVFNPDDNTAEDLLKRGDVIAMLAQRANESADYALDGQPLNARSRESMEAAYTRAKHAVAFMPPATTEATGVAPATTPADHAPTARAGGEE